MPKARRGRNEGSLFFSDTRKRWTTFVTVDGKRYYRHAKTKDEARLKLLNLQSMAIQGQLGESTDKPGAKQTVEQAVVAWYESAKSNGKIRQSTYRRYESLLLHKIRPELGPLLLADLAPAHLEGLYKRIVNEGNSQASALKVANMMHGALERAVRLGQLPENVCNRADKPKVTKPEVEYFEKAELDSLLSTATKQGDRDAELYYIASRTGMRMGELLALQWCNVDLKTGRLSVLHTLLNDNGKMSLGQPKTVRSVRNIVLSPLVVDAFKRQQTGLFSEGLRASAYVFPNKKGNPQQRNHVYARFQKLCGDAGLKARPFQALRHTCATHMLVQAVHPKIVQELLGHANINLTLGTYSHVIPSMQEDAAKRMDDYFMADEGAGKVSSKVS